MHNALVRIRDRGVARVEERQPGDAPLAAADATLGYSPEPNRSPSVGNLMEVAERLLSVRGRVRLTHELQQLRLNRKRLTGLRNIHSGRRAVIVGNGPSLNTTDLSVLEYEVTFAFNGVFLLSADRRFWPTYYVVEDRLVAEDRAREINAFEASEKLYVYDQWDRLHGGIYLPWVTQFEPYPQFSMNVSDVAFSGWTVTFLALQLALYMGVRDVVLVGMDGTYQDPIATSSGGVLTSAASDVNHFHPDYFGPGYRFHPPDAARIGAAHALAARVFQAHGGRVRNATPGTRLQEYDVVPFNEAFGSGNE